MADVVIPNGYGQATMSWTNSELAAPVTVTCGYANTVAFHPVDENAESIYLFWTASPGPCLASFMQVGWTFQGVYCLQRSATGVLTSNTYAAPINGTMTATGGGQPAYSPLVVSKTTAIAGKAFRGRMYPPMTYSNEGSVSLGGNIETVVALPQIRASYSALFNDWEASDIPPFLLHSDVGTPPTAINTFFVRPVVGTQRRRKNR